MDNKQTRTTPGWCSRTISRERNWRYACGSEPRWAARKGRWHWCVADQSTDLAAGGATASTNASPGAATRRPATIGWRHGGGPAAAARTSERATAAMGVAAAHAEIRRRPVASTAIRRRGWRRMGRHSPTSMAAKAQAPTPGSGGGLRGLIDPSCPGFSVIAGEVSAGGNIVDMSRWGTQRYPCTRERRRSPLCLPQAAPTMDSHEG